MGFKGRTGFLVIAICLMAAAVFAYDALRRGLWANAVLGGLSCGLLLVATIVLGNGRRQFPEPPQPTPPDARGLHRLLDQVPLPLVTYSELEGAQAVNREARSLFRTDGPISSEDHELVRAMTGLLPGTRPKVRILGRQYALSIGEVVGEDSHLRLATLTDVQMEIHKAEAAALRDMLHILSHEIMNSLVPVASLAEIADSYLADEANPSVPPAREALEMLSRRATSLTRFIETYRSVARLPEPVLQPIEPLTLIQDIVALFSHSRDAREVKFELQAQADLPRINADEAQITQALINVVTNAVEATEANQDERRVAIDVAASHQTLVIRVADNGSGVPESIQVNLFNAFTTTKAKGSGAGLNLARQITLAHGGNLELQNDGRIGDTVFAFTLPFAS